MFELLIDLEFFLMLNNIKFDFLTLSISLLACWQPVLYIIKSIIYNIFKLLSSCHLQRDEMKPLGQIRKYHLYKYRSDGPRTLPCGTPHNV